ncbi:MAG TPA: hypothetical protein VHX13_06405 [Acidobacteriaceae bacterium]|jgi:hypothetical protein|nr:hypothetical protein [Acidobacteriaceae bacterium]
MSAVAVEPALATELWVSFVSLLRSYAAVTGLHGGESVDVSVAGNSVVFCSGLVECSMRVARRTGVVSWNLREKGPEMAAGRFELLPDGRIQQDGLVQEMDSVAIDMVARVRDRAVALAGSEGRP